MSADLLLWAIRDALLEDCVTRMWEDRTLRGVDSEGDDWIARLGAWRMTWWR